MFRGSIVALVTPFRDGAIDEKALGDLIEWHIAEGTDGFVPVGTTGESPTLSHAEHERVVEQCIRVVAGRRPVIAGAGSNSTREAINLAQHAEKAGADAALVVTPYYNKPTQAGLYAHYKAIHDATGIPIIIYNIPGRSIVDMTPETMGRLAQLPRIIGVKDASNDIVRPLLTTETCGPDFLQLSGEDANILAFLAHGGHGCISVTANVAPKLCAELHAAWAAGQAEQALAIHRRLMPLHQALFCESSPAPTKYALSLLGRCGAELRLPLVEPLPSSQERIAGALRAVGLKN
ncbi:MAG TPA: 4-hydroxy-tetrahydrodipicolinate synthase [Geminicoccus sp.]|jgi:4-hydroxy-tetrahydrodipicolinate synthase|uniref:4-hydroxy-tetrahydrodipicolinate synthase n=1 Tax=Geminicoccus sp. TaxID=2024832 RepID=UPI002E33C0DF|nr:4-hydroxy-tetrahydrodipicolinate synthase [Geminicoccus sp.]HEX2525761.1 4-hydroxy-tetrahydrodipicolinate synthase [Geminicoccus sp.]